MASGAEGQRAPVQSGWALPLGKATMTVSWRHRIVIGVLIVGVGGFALTPAAYLVLRAWRLERALHILEIIFFPLFILFGTGALLAYRRSRARHTLSTDDPMD